MTGSLTVKTVLLIALVAGLSRHEPSAAEKATAERVPAEDTPAESAPKELQGLGAKVTRDEQRPSRPVVSVDLSNRTVIEVTRRRWLNNEFSWITDAALVNLEGLTQLRELNLNRAAVTDGGLVHLGGLTCGSRRGRPIRDAARSCTNRAAEDVSTACCLLSE
jgi:hypothetical protein